LHLEGVSVLLRWRAARPVAASVIRRWISRASTILTTVLATMLAQPSDVTAQFERLGNSYRRAPGDRRDPAAFIAYNAINESFRNL